MEIARHEGRGTAKHGKKDIICQNMNLPELTLFPELVIKSLKREHKTNHRKLERRLQKLV